MVVHEVYHQGHSYSSFPLFKRISFFYREIVSTNFGWNNIGVAPGVGVWYDRIYCVFNVTVIQKVIFAWFTAYRFII